MPNTCSRQIEVVISTFSSPTDRVPAGRQAPAGWDSHAHVIGNVRAFPFSPGRGYTPEPAPLESYLAMLDDRGLARGVLVQPSVYGFDHRCLLDALDRANGRLCGIAVPDPESTFGDLEVLHQHGVRGVRCNLINPGGLSLGAVAGWRDVLRTLGWHVQLHVPIADCAPCVDVLEALDVPIVIDHMGRPAPGQVDPSAPGPKTLIEFVRDARCFVKLSAPYRLSEEGQPWRDVEPLARALAAANPRRCLWGSDWPHTDVSSSVRVDDLTAALQQWCPDPDTRAIVTTQAAQQLFAGTTSP